MERFMRNMGLGGQLPRDLQGGGNQGDTPMVDTAEQVYISSLSLLKMLKHGRAGVPMEVMG
jgi:26S proteasome regulatory subunit N11